MTDCQYKVSNTYTKPRFKLRKNYMIIEKFLASKKIFSLSSLGYIREFYYNFIPSSNHRAPCNFLYILPSKSYRQCYLISCEGKNLMTNKLRHIRTYKFINCFLQKAPLKKKQKNSRLISMLQQVNSS